MCGPLVSPMAVPNLRDHRVNFVRALWQATTEKLVRAPNRPHRKIDLRRLVLLSNVLHNCEVFAQEIQNSQATEKPKSAPPSPAKDQEQLAAPEASQKPTVCSDITNSAPASPQPMKSRPALKRHHSDAPEAPVASKRKIYETSEPARPCSAPPEVSSDGNFSISDLNVLISQASLSSSPVFLIPCEQNDNTGQTVIFPSQAYLVVCPPQPTVQ